MECGGLGIDPKLRRCICGYTWTFNRLDYLRMLFHDITYTCPKCNRVHQYHMTRFVNEVWSNDVKKRNKELIEGKKEVYKRC